MSTLEDDIRDALRDEATRLRGVRPLRLQPAGPVGRQALPGRRRARWLRTWMPPLTTAAMVVALAISLVTAKSIRGEGGAPAVSPALGRYGIPRFYVTLPAPGLPGQPMRSLVVGDTFTGAKVATVAAPKGTQFTGVSAAGDGRTFVVEAMPAPRSALPAVSAVRQGIHGPLTWYLLRIAPGTRAPARLTRVPISDRAQASPATGIWGFALSGSGRQLAVGLGTGGFNGPLALRVYSVATGQVTGSWSAAAGSLTAGLSGLTWVNGDSAVGFGASQPGSRPVSGVLGILFARVLDLRARGGDLLKDSRVAWSLEAPGPHGTWSYVGPLLGCGFPYLTPTASAVVCVATSWTNPPGGMAATTHWAAFPAAVPAQGRVTCRITFSVPGQSKAVAVPQIYWMSPSGDTLVSSDGATSRIGIVRHGTFTPLPVDGANPADGDLAL
jgi:hypothetical protein